MKAVTIRAGHVRLPMTVRQHARLPECDHPPPRDHPPAGPFRLNVTVRLPLTIDQQATPVHLTPCLAGRPRASWTVVLTTKLPSCEPCSPSNRHLQRCYPHCPAPILGAAILSTRLPACTLAHPPVCLLACRLPACPSACLPACLPTRPSACLPACLPAHTTPFTLHAPADEDQERPLQQNGREAELDGRVQLQRLYYITGPKFVHGRGRRKSGGTHQGVRHTADLKG
eukprot:364283-Chlamydomonas_euryale.AAC.16